MTRRFARLIGVLALCLWAWSPSAVQADQGRREQATRHSEPDRHHEYSRQKHWRAHKHDHGFRARGYRGYGHAYQGWRHGRRGVRKYVYDDGFCRTTYKFGKHGIEYTVRCRGREFHGRRSKRYERHGSGYGRGGGVFQLHYTAQTLESAADDQSIVWNGSRAQSQHEIVPSQTYRAGIGRYCREYLNPATVGGQTREVFGQACRQEDGSWEIVR